MSYGVKLDLGGPIGDYIGFFGGLIKGCTTNLVQGLDSFRESRVLFAFRVCSPLYGPDS